MRKITKFLLMSLCAIPLAFVASSIIQFELVNNFKWDIVIDLKLFYKSIMESKQHVEIFKTVMMAFVGTIFIILNYNFNPHKPDVIRVTNKIIIPAPAGEGQFGRARFITKKEYNKAYPKLKLYKKDIDPLIKRGIEERKRIKKYKRSAEVEIFDPVGLDTTAKEINQVVEAYFENKISQSEYDNQIETLTKQYDEKKAIVFKVEKAIEIRAKLKDIDEQVTSIEGTDIQALENQMTLIQNKAEEAKRLYSEGRITESQYHEFVQSTSSNLSKTCELIELHKGHENTLSQKNTLEFIHNGITNDLANTGYSVSELFELYTNRSNVEVSLPENINFNLKLECSLVIGFEKKLMNEILHMISGDKHTLTYGSTGSGKTRCILLESICVTALTGDSMVIADPKGELSAYTAPFLKWLGYRVLMIDFKSPLKSDHYNFLQPIIDAIDNNDIPKAIEATWDITAQLVGDTKGEKIWQNGEASIIAACIMAVVFDNKDGDNRKYQNMPNVYYFIAEMCTEYRDKDGNPVLPLTMYFEKQSDNHPAKGLSKISTIAPERTRGSFFTSALTTLRLFTNPYIHNMTSCSDYTPESLGDGKVALFICVPDERKTYHDLAALLITQHYAAQVKYADSLGGRLPKRVIYFLEEFGNLPYINDLTAKLTVSRSRGILFHFFIQGKDQLKLVYDEETANIIVGNVDVQIFLKSGDPKTLEGISKDLDNYTTFTYSKSDGRGDKAQKSLAGRLLLTVDDLQNLERPYALLISQTSGKAITMLPDISKWYFNKILGMGGKKHNEKLRMMRDDERPIKSLDSGELQLWGIWNYYIKAIKSAPSKKQSGSTPSGKLGSDFLKQFTESNK